MDHPLNELSVKNGKVVRSDPGGYDSEYLSTQPISVTARKNIQEIDSREVSYKFDLNDRPDPVWIELFSTHLDGIHAGIAGAELEFRCIPANLTGRYQKVKDAIAKANAGYASLKTLLLAKVTSLDEQRRQQADAQEGRSKTIRDQFNDLQL